MSKLLEKHHRKKQRTRQVFLKDRLTEEQIVAWADEHFRVTGKWPWAKSGPVIGMEGENWAAINADLSGGSRGLPGGSSVAKLLDKHGRKRLASRLTEQQILCWADDHFRQTGKWPVAKSGPVLGTEKETWSAIEAALLNGARGLPGGSSLGRLLDKHGRKKSHLGKPRLTEEQILAWADDHHDRMGEWPRPKSGLVIGADGETWAAIGSALSRGTRGLRGGATIPQLLEKHDRKKRRHCSPSPLKLLQPGGRKKRRRKKRRSWRRQFPK